MKVKNKLKFYGGPWVSFLPFLIFVAVAIFICLKNAPDIRGMWLGAISGIMITMFFCKDKLKYSDAVVEGMADRIAIIPIACWLFAGVFAAVLRASGLVEGIIWGAYQIGASGRVFVIVSFLASMIFATAAGTGFGTIIAGMSVLYPAGVLLGANPVILAGAIIGGGAFGDNMAPISDTTIVSAASQGTDVGGVVKSRLKYALLSAFITVIFMGIFGEGGHVGTVPEDMIKEYMDPKGLVMLIPAALTIYLAIRKGNIITATTVGTLVSILFALAFRLITWEQLIMIKEGAVGGILVDGMGGMVDICILALLVLACVHIMKAGGGDQKLIHVANRLVKTARGAEMSIAVIILAMSSIMGLNAPPILAVGTSYAKPVGEKFKLHPYRRANIMDATSCTLVYALPWTPTLLLAQNFAKAAHEQFGPLVPALTPNEMTPWIIYSWVLLIVIASSILFGWGRIYEGEDGKVLKSLTISEEI